MKNFAVAVRHEIETVENNVGVLRTSVSINNVGVLSADMLFDFINNFLEFFAAIVVIIFFDSQPASNNELATASAQIHRDDSVSAGKAGILPIYQSGLKRYPYLFTKKVCQT